MHDFLHDGSRVQDILDITRAAGEMASAFFRLDAKTSAKVHYKEGGSPVTEADLIVDRFLQDRLSALLPGAGWLSEETADSNDRLGKPLVFVVDPIDGTRCFTKGDPHWAVCVAVVADGQPLLGVVHAPALAETYVATAGGGATLNGVAAHVSDATIGGPAPLLTGSPQPLGRALAAAGLNIALQPRIGSLAIRISRVAAGRLDLGFAGGSSRDWDIAAADLILREAGGRLADLRGEVPCYNRADPRHGLLTAAAAGIHADVTAATRRAMGLEAI